MEKKVQNADNHRIKILRSHLNLAQGEFANLVNLKQGSYSDVERGKASISPQLLKKLIELFNVNANWLLTGKGDMFSAGIDNILKEPEPTYEKQKIEIITVTLDNDGNAAIPVLNIKAAAGLPNNFNNSDFYKNLPALSMPMPQYKTGDWALIQASGTSMERTIYHGQWLMCKRVYEASDIKDNNVYVLVLTTGTVVKRVLNRVKKRGTLVLQSDNPDYDLVEVDAMADVLQIWMVEMVWVFDLHNRNIDLMKELTTLKEKIMLIEKSLKNT